MEGTMQRFISNMAACHMASIIIKPINQILYGARTSQIYSNNPNKHSLCVNITLYYEHAQILFVE
jgi:hypothetical protein